MDRLQRSTQEELLTLTENGVRRARRVMKKGGMPAFPSQTFIISDPMDENSDVVAIYDSLMSYYKNAGWLVGREDNESFSPLIIERVENVSEGPDKRNEVLVKIRVGICASIFPTITINSELIIE